MAFCATCGASVEGRFCAKCGTPVQEAPAPGPAPSQGAPGAGFPPSSGPQYAAPASAGMSDSTASGLCYLVGLITGILFLVLEPYNKNRAIRFHAFQSIFLNVAYIVAWIAVTIVISVLSAVVHMFGLLFFLTPLIGLAFFVLWLYVMITAFQGKAVSLPIIGPLAQKQA